AGLEPAPPDALEARREQLQLGALLSRERLARLRASPPVDRVAEGLEDVRLRAGIPRRPRVVEHRAERVRVRGMRGVATDEGAEAVEGHDDRDTAAVLGHAAVLVADLPTDRAGADIGGRAARGGVRAEGAVTGAAVEREGEAR